MCTIDNDITSIISYNTRAEESLYSQEIHKSTSNTDQVTDQQNHSLDHDSKNKEEMTAQQTLSKHPALNMT